MLNSIAEEKRSNEELKNENTQLQTEVADLRDSLARSKVCIHIPVLYIYMDVYKWHALEHPYVLHNLADTILCIMYATWSDCVYIRTILLSTPHYVALKAETEATAEERDSAREQIVALKKEKGTSEERLETMTQSLMAQRKEVDGYEVGYCLASSSNASLSSLPVCFHVYI